MLAGAHSIDDTKSRSRDRAGALTGRDGREFLDIDDTVEATCCAGQARREARRHQHQGAPTPRRAMWRTGQAAPVIVAAQSRLLQVLSLLVEVLKQARELLGCCGRLWRPRVHCVLSAATGNVLGMKPDPVTAPELRDAIAASWRRETTNDPTHWRSTNPAWGQCAVTALVVQEYLGGQLLRAVVGGVSHYWNELPSGEELDLTRHQFDHYAPQGREHRSREYVLSFPGTRLRYVRLLTLVAEQLEAQRGRLEELASPV